MPPRDSQRIFLLTHEGVGDLVFLLPTLHALRESLPDATIKLVVSRTQQALASTLDGRLADTLPIYDRGILPLIGALRRFKPDVLFEFDGGFRYAVASLSCSARRRIHPPWELVKPYAALMHAETLRFNAAGHRVETLLSLLDMLGLPRKRISFEFDVPDRYVENAVSIAGRYIPRGTIALIPVSGHRCKDWPAASVQETIDILSRDLGRPVVLVGRDPFPGVTGAIDLGGKSDFLTDAYLLRYSGVFDVVAGVDTGMMQVAGSISSDAEGRYGSAQGTKTVSLFGPTDFRIYRPYDPTGAFNLVVAPKVRSSLMGPVGWAGDKLERPYMEEIEPREIVASIVRHLAQEDAVVPRMAQGRH